MSILSAITLIDALRQYRLLPADQLGQLDALAATFPDPRALARELLQRGWLTAFQVNQLLTDKGGELALGAYVLIERLGEGGMGQVFKARNLKMDRVVALKVMRKDRLQNQEAVRRFQREVRVGAQLNHPHIVQTFDADQFGDRHIMVMEYVEGTDLSKRVRQSGPLPVDQACEYIRQAALGLQHACERGMVHRDIKPGNLMVGKPVGDSVHGQVKVLDMGLARMVRPVDGEDSTDSWGTLTQQGLVMGTLDFLAPEQAQDSHTVDIRADLYALGCTFYFILTGQVPFPGGSSPEKLLKHRLDQPTPVERLRPEVPPAAAWVVRKLMAKRPGDRFQTPAEAAEVLADIVAGRPVEVPEPSPSDPAIPVAVATALPVAEVVGDTPMATLYDATTEHPSQRPLSRLTSHRWVLFAGAGSGALFLAVIVLLLRSGGPAPAPPTFAKATRPTPTPTLAAVPATKTQRPASPLDVLDRRTIPAGELFDDQPKELVAVLGKHAEGGWGPLLDRRRHPSFVLAVAWSKDGKRIASGGQDSAIRLWSPDRPAMLGQLDGHKGPVLVVAFSADGQQLISASRDGDVRLWDIDQGKTVRQFQGHAGAVHGAAISSDGSRVLTGGADKTVRLWDAATGKELQRWENHTETVWCVTFSPDGMFALSGSRDKTARLWDVGAGKEVKALTGHSTCVHAVDFSPDGGRALTGSCDRTARVWDLKTGKETRRFAGHEMQINGVAFSPDGTEALTASWDRTVRIWDVETGKEKRQLEGHLDMVWGVAFSPDGKRAVSCSGGQERDGKTVLGTDNTVRIWDLAKGTEIVPFEGRGPVYSLAFSGDGSQLLTGGADGVVRLWDVPAAKETRRLLGHRGQVRDVALSADGKTALSGGDDRTMRVWDVAAGTETRQFDERINPLLQMALSPDGRRALSAGDAALGVWDVGSGQEIGRFKGHSGPILGVAWSADARRAATGGEDRTVRVWDMESGKQWRRFDGHDGPVNVVALSADGRYAASGGPDRTVRVWDLQLGTEARRYDWHQAPISSVSFSPDGQLLASTDYRGRIILREPAAGGNVRDWQFPGPVHAAAFARDGRHLATANHDGTVYILRLAK